VEPLRKIRLSDPTLLLWVAVLTLIDVKNVGKIIKNVKKRKKRYKNKKR